MCIIAIAWQLFDEMPLVILSNRDEFLERPTTAVHQWQDAPIFAGRDDRSGGTWLGIHQYKDQNSRLEQNGRWAAVLNFRDGVQASEDERSRGELVAGFLTSDLSPMAFARRINLQDYAGFNLIVGDTQQAVMVNNRGYAPTPLYAGLHVLSNGQPDDSWFKTERLRGRLRQEVLPLISEDSSLEYWQAAAWEVLSDDQQAPDNQLPDTGIAPEIEQSLSSICISNAALPNYGTRTQSILTLRTQQPSQNSDLAKPIASLISREFKPSI